MARTFSSGWSRETRNTRQTAFAAMHGNIHQNDAPENERNAAQNRSANEMHPDMGSNAVRTYRRRSIPTMDFANQTREAEIDA